MFLYIKIMTLTYDSTLGIKDISLGRFQANMHTIGKKMEKVAVFYNNPPGYADKEGDLIAIYPFPQKDIYINQQPITCLVKGETAYTLPTLPGFLEYYEEMGIIESKEQVVELCYSADPNNIKGFPECDLFSLAQKQNVDLSIYDGVIAIFAAPYVKEQIEAMGGIAPQQSNSAKTNNKAEFRKNAAIYDYPVAKGIELHNLDHLNKALKEFKDSERIWFKLDRAASGTLVLPIDPPFTLEKAEETIAQLKHLTQLAFDKNDFSIEAKESFWAKDQQFPDKAVIFAEDHIHYVLNASNILVIHEDGRYNTPIYFKQLTTDEGKFLGGCILEVNEEDQLLLNTYMERIARYCAEDLKIFGLLGVDFGIVEDHEHHKFLMIEINGRPSANTLALILANKLNVSTWLNVKAWTPEKIESMADFKKYFEGYLDKNIDKGFCVPQAFVTIYGMDEKKQKNLIHPSNEVKILVCGNSLEHCQNILTDLETRGLKFQN